MFKSFASSCLKLLPWVALFLKTGHLGVSKMCLGTTGETTEKRDCADQNGTNGLFKRNPPLRHSKSAEVGDSQFNCQYFCSAAACMSLVNKKQKHSNISMKFSFKISKYSPSNNSIKLWYGLLRGEVLPHLFNNFPLDRWSSSTFL
ncbi:hypothetical protein AVEN_170938-1 [Araneus ventricosus]|uniref:Secreted protein n=1 Tax=Araneus ventricosus TaxID=182803 RepID=A0A4Y2MAQ4_ARAVE|nr:hypothetical protein AVEN_170938-1 [Araneus ventricosus]